MSNKHEIRVVRGVVGGKGQVLAFVNTRLVPNANQFITVRKFDLVDDEQDECDDRGLRTFYIESVGLVCDGPSEFYLAVVR